MIHLSGEYQVTPDGRIVKKQQSKMHNVKASRDGIVFDSQLEEQRYQVLKDMQEQGEIRNLVVHPAFELQEAFRARNGKRYRAVTYEADFMYYAYNGTIVVEDTKGYRTPKFIIQEKLFRFKNPAIDYRVGDEIWELTEERIASKLSSS